MVYESIDHGNDVTCHALFSEKLRRKFKINVIVKNKSITIFHGLHYTLIDHRNYAIKCSNLCVKPLVCGSWIYLSLEHFMMSFLWSIRV